MRIKYDMNDFSNIALIQTAFIGDIALSLNMAQAIKQMNPNCKLIFVSTPQALELVNAASHIDEVIVYDKRDKDNGWRGIVSLSKKLRSLNVDLIFTPHRSLRSTLATFLAKPKLSIGFDKNSMAWLYDTRVKYRNDYHEIDRNFEMLKLFNMHDSELPPKNVDLKFYESDIDFVDNLLLMNGVKDYIVIAPGSVWATKRWKEEHFIDLCKLIKSSGRKCILIGSKSDKFICDRISQASDTISFAGETTIPQTLLILNKAKMLITNDSAPIHFAGLVNCTTIAIFGPTIQGFGFYPRGRNDIVVENNNLKCRPCGIHGGNSCPIKTHICMQSISPNEVFHSILKIEEITS